MPKNSSSRSLSVRDMAIAGLIAALYAVLGYFANIFGVAFGPVQVRFAEALCVLPFFFPAAVPGLFIGCFITNLLSPYGALDVIFGSLATLLAAAWTRRIRFKWLAPLPPVVCNALIIPALIAVQSASGAEAFGAVFLYNALTIGLGELLACYLLGGILLTQLPKIPSLKRYFS